MSSSPCDHTTSLRRSARIAASYRCLSHLCLSHCSDKGFALTSSNMFGALVNHAWLLLLRGARGVHASAHQAHQQCTAGTQADSSGQAGRRAHQPRVAAKHQAGRHTAAGRQPAELIAQVLHQPCAAAGRQAGRRAHETRQPCTAASRQASEERDTLNGMRMHAALSLPDAWWTRKLPRQCPPSAGSFPPRGGSFPCTACTALYGQHTPAASHTDPCLQPLPPPHHPPHAPLPPALTSPDLN